jgi:hypothetical protein
MGSSAIALKKISSAATTLAEEESASLVFVDVLRSSRFVR